MIGCLIRIQRKNSYSLEAVQRLVEETPSFATPSTIRRSLPMSAGNEERMIGAFPQSNTLYNVIRGLYRSDIMMDSVSIDTACSSIYSLEKWEDNNKKLDNIINLNEQDDISDKKISAACDDDTEENRLEESPSVCTLLSAAGYEEHNYSHITDGNGKRKVSQRIQSLYAKVKKGPRFSPVNSTVTGKTDVLCGDAYEMVDISRGVDHDKTFQDSKTDAESTKNQTTVSDDNNYLATTDDEPTEQ
ncbi:hypothetical protein CHS0354_012586 [Potamilus streckersoni]|uniref:Uncharacterized protein n=1 Tax=Potamilus streckersoni TaxID=2493646 RepID=A0AAE0W497_9BIVA|nr:hypothetical protein CHS0354_012586 [Potamilus streckersoni]